VFDSRGGSANPTYPPRDLLLAQQVENRP
jgi:hypothetical protein